MTFSPMQRLQSLQKHMYVCGGVCGGCVGVCGCGCGCVGAGVCMCVCVCVYRCVLVV